MFFKWSSEKLQRFFYMPNRGYDYQKESNDLAVEYKTGIDVVLKKMVPLMPGPFLFAV